MSVRSDAWYAENRERRQATMRAYANALTLLGQRYPDKRHRLYQRFLDEGLTATQARYCALTVIRDVHKPEFRKIVGSLREAEVPVGAP